VVNPASFVQVSSEAIALLYSNRLTKTDHRLYWYLAALDPWGQKFVELPSQSEIALALGVTRESVNRSAAKLQQLGLFDFQIYGWRGKNTSIATKQEPKPYRSKWKDYQADDSDFFKWVCGKCRSLPKQPADLASAAEAWIRKQGATLHKEWENSQAPEATPKPLPKAVPESDPLPRLRAKYNQPRSRAKAIAEAQQLGFTEQHLQTPL
jgi:hypothetical protein